MVYLNKMKTHPVDIMTVSSASSASDFLVIGNGSLLGPKSSSATVALVTASAANPTILIVIFFSEYCILWNSAYDVRRIAVDVCCVSTVAYSFQHSSTTVVIDQSITVWVSGSFFFVNLLMV